MKRHSLIVAAFVFTSVLFVGVILLPEARATTRYVGGVGPGNYTTIQLAIDDADPGDTVFVFNDGAPYHENIIIGKTMNLVGEDRDTVIIDGDDAGDVVTVNSDWVNVTGFTIMNGSCGFNLDFTSNGNITGNNILHNWGGIAFESSSGISITENNISSNDADGIDVLASANIKISGNVVSMNGQDGLYLSWSSNNRITGNNVSLNGIMGIDVEQGSDNNIIADNSLHKNGRGLSSYMSSNNTITGNDIVNNGILLFGWLAGTSTHTIVNNTVNGKPLLYYRDRIGLTIDGRTVGQLILANCTDVEVRNLRIDSTDAGMQIMHSTSITVAGSELGSDNDFGIYIGQSSDSVISGNYMTKNRYGVYIKDSTNISISANRVLMNEYEGIVISASDNEIVGNYVSDNWGGIIVIPSSGNRVYHNSVVNNTIQAYDNSAEINHWDDGYPSGGNYWSDYVGVDDCRGPTQSDCTGGDGIGDQPYLFDEGKQDDYPLMYPKIFLPPSDVGAILSGSNHEDVIISWSRSLDDGAGVESVVGYEVFRSLVYHPQGSGYGQVATLPNGTSIYVDGLAGEGNPNDYFYTVCAVDGFGNSSCSRNQAGKFTRPLPSGPNPISIPLVQSNESIDVALQTVEYDKAWYYDSTSQEWKWCMEPKRYRRGLWELDHTLGIWVNVTRNSNLTVAGAVPAETAMHLFEGWNLVSFPSFNTTYTIADLKAEIGATRVEGYDLGPPYFLRVLGNVEVLQAGYGYWVKVDIDVDWIVEVS
jgi:parallel beta-helix repeat protein